jgi:hypothetical protein
LVSVASAASAAAAARLPREDVKVYVSEDVDEEELLVWDGVMVMFMELVVPLLGSVGLAETETVPVTVASRKDISSGLIQAVEPP